MYTILICIDVMKCPEEVMIHHVARNIFEDLLRVLRHLVVCLPWVKWGVKLLCVADLSCYVSGRSAGNLVVSSQRDYKFIQK